MCPYSQTYSSQVNKMHISRLPALPDSLEMLNWTFRFMIWNEILFQYPAIL